MFTSENMLNSKNEMFELKCDKQVLFFDNKHGTPFLFEAYFRWTTFIAANLRHISEQQVH